MNNVHRPTLIDTGLLLIRLMVGIVFIFHGAQKLFGAFGGPGISGFTGALEGMGVPMPGVSAWLAALAEFGGGILLIIGTGARIGAFFIACNMLVAVLVVHRGAFSAQNDGMEYPLTLLIVCIALMLMGPGRFTIAQLFGGRRHP